MEKKTWEKPEMEVVEIEVEDRVIVISGGDEGYLAGCD